MKRLQLISPIILALAAVPAMGAAVALHDFPSTVQVTGFASQDSNTDTSASALSVKNLGTFGGLI